MQQITKMQQYYGTVMSTIRNCISSWYNIDMQIKKKIKKNIML